MNRNFKSAAKHLELDDVKQAAERLMLLNDYVTTLEVKNLLRAQGFIAFQSDVSDMMAILSDHHGWPFTCNGHFRSYCFRHFLEYQLCPDIPRFSLN